MAIQSCPRCHTHSFDIDDDAEDQHTLQWRCHACGLTALEPEENHEACPKCGYKAQHHRLLIGEQAHHWCGRCGAFDAITG